jgi:quercetin dioxygenase-like cupin family protein
MRNLSVTVFLLTVGTLAFAQTGAQTEPARSAKEMVIARAGSQASYNGPAQYFTGNARVDPLFSAHSPSTMAGAAVTFEPGARSAWHTHPAGQILIVTAGVGRIQQASGPVLEIRPGDVIWTPPGVKHWHGAAPSTAVTHIAMQESVSGTNVEWMEKVSDEQYGK